ncbi:hypothetical protein M407DRAFT_242734 [Tulasnella calospora MUT 4182]|uniref:VWFA domain-containing protein n=1 Tax=Tulasnella calospora MUT 4182 TaxID=1051891 RepID=A0A0C3QPD3_9AGAM|nr:hypothetical protein M407DRAFT_242734 [Tulasnella calospora MUT 4182]
MVLEASMIVIDNSEYMRNGDYTPTRFASQSDAVNVIFGRKTNANPENTVGLMTSGGKTPQVLVTPTTDIGKILSGLHGTQVSGEADLITSLQVAQLALKHRQNKNQRQRIVAFVGSPIKPKADEKSLVKLAKKLKKNNVSVDIVSFGSDEEIEDNEGILRAFVDAVQSGENCHLVTVPAGANLLSDAIVSSAILAGESGLPGEFGAGEASGSGAQNSFEFGVDPSLDPELAMALRMSLEEEQARIAAQGTQNPAATGAASSTLTSIPENAASGGAATAVPNLMDQDDEDEELTQALLMSQQDQGGGSKVDDEDVDMDAADDEDEDGDEDDGEEEDDDEEAIAKAIAMSMAEEEKKKAEQQPPKK